MTEPFNVEKFRQQMRGQVPVAPQAVSAQMQAAPAAIPQAVPAHMQGVPAVMPQAVPQPYPAPQMQGQMATQHAPQPMVPQPMAPPMPQNPGFQPQLQAQPYSPPAAGQPQAWVPQGQAMQAPQGPQMMQPPVYATPPAAVDALPLDEAASKKPRFSLKRLKKVKAPKIEKTPTLQPAKAQTVEAEIDSPEGHSTKMSPAMIFMFGMATGIVCFLVGNMIMSNLFASKPTNNIADIAKRNASIQQPVLPTKQVSEAKDLNAKAE